MLPPCFESSLIRQKTGHLLDPCWSLLQLLVAPGREDDWTPPSHLLTSMAATNCRSASETPSQFRSQEFRTRWRRPTMSLRETLMSLIKAFLKLLHSFTTSLFFCAKSAISKFSLTLSCLIFELINMFQLLEQLEQKLGQTESACFQILKLCVPWSVNTVIPSGTFSVINPSLTDK